MMSADPHWNYQVLVKCFQGKVTAFQAGMDNTKLSNGFQVTRMDALSFWSLGRRHTAYRGADTIWPVQRKAVINSQGQLDALQSSLQGPPDAKRTAQARPETSERVCPHPTAPHSSWVPSQCYYDTEKKATSTSFPMSKLEHEVQRSRKRGEGAASPGCFPTLVFSISTSRQTEEGLVHLHDQMGNFQCASHQVVDDSLSIVPLFFPAGQDSPML